MDKKCSKCQITKTYSEFHKQKTRKDGFRSHCKLCVKEESLNYYTDNKNNILKNKKQYYIENDENIKTKRKIYVSLNTEKTKNSTYKSYHKNKDKYKPIQKKYRDNNKNKIRETQNKIAKSKYSSDPTYKLKSRVKNMIYYGLKSVSSIKNNRTHEILGCTYEELKKHLESKFLDWMNWSNHGKYNGQLNYGWDIDHKVPISSAKTEADIIRLSHYSNLQPLCGKVNRDIKRDNLTILK